MNGPKSGWEACGPKALAVLDEILAERPKKDGQKLTDVTQTLCSYRDGLIARAEAGGPEAQRDLEHVNAVLSIVAGVHFPLGGIPWNELEGARGWLADLIGRVSPAAETA